MPINKYHLLSDEELHRFIELYPNTSKSELASTFSISLNQVDSIKRKFNLKQDVELKYCPQCTKDLRLSRFIKYKDDRRSIRCRKCTYNIKK